MIMIMISQYQAMLHHDQLHLWPWEIGLLHLGTCSSDKFQVHFECMSYCHVSTLALCFCMQAVMQSCSCTVAWF